MNQTVKNLLDQEFEKFFTMLNIRVVDQDTGALIHVPFKDILDYLQVKIDEMNELYNRIMNEG